MLTKIGEDTDSLDQWGIITSSNLIGMQGSTWQTNYVTGFNYLAIGI